MLIEPSTPEIQLAVDLIYLLESNDVDPNIALAALNIACHDYKDKLHKLNEVAEIS